MSKAGEKALKELAEYCGFDAYKAFRMCVWMARVSNAEHSFEMGRDYCVNGANSKNCHYSLFSTRECADAWEAGRRAASVY